MLSAMKTSEQVEFLRQNQSLTRLCFMEYSLNALLDWLPCEKDLLFAMYPVMNTYSSVAVAMCDVFRQDAISTGHEDWAQLNRAAAISIERCIRVCRFSQGQRLAAAAYLAVGRPSYQHAASDGAGSSMKSVHIPLSDFHPCIFELPYMQCLLEHSSHQIHNHTSRSGQSAGQPGSKKRLKADAESNNKQNEEIIAAVQKEERRVKLQLLEALVVAGQYKNGCSALLDVYRQVHENFSIHRLPENVAWLQMQCLEGMHSSCSSRYLRNLL